MQNNTEISERIKQLIEYLQINANKFAKVLGYERSQTIYDILSGKSAPSFDFFNRLENSEYSVKVNTKWLLTGKGELSPKNYNIVSEPQSQYNITNNSNKLPLIPLNAVAGLSNGTNDTILEVDCVYYDVPEFNKKADYLIRITGSSMSPKYHSGDIVACKKLSLDTFFQWNKVYVVDTEQGPLVKRIRKSSMGDDHILLFSDNANYDPFDLPRKSLNAIGLVIGVIRLE